MGGDADAAVAVRELAALCRCPELADVASPQPAWVRPPMADGPG